MTEPIDLDAAERLLAEHFLTCTYADCACETGHFDTTRCPNCDHGYDWHRETFIDPIVKRADLTALVAELRAARKVVEDCIQLDNGYLSCRLCYASTHAADGRKSIIHLAGCALAAHWGFE